METHVGIHGVEPVCKVLQIAPSTWYEHARRKANPDLRSVRAREDERLCKEITRVHAANFGVYGARKIWLQLNREGISIGRDRVARLMVRLGLEGVVRGKAVRTTVSDKAAACPFDLVNRQFHAPAPNKLWGEADKMNLPVEGSSAERLHLCLDLGRLRLCGFRH
jgi:transposase InsO family protein